MTAREITVRHCGECPAYGERANLVTASRAELRSIDGVCRVLSRHVWRDDPERPEWCPLNDGPIVLRVRS